MLSLLSERGVLPINSKKASFLGNELEEKGPISSQIAGHVIHLVTHIPYSLKFSRPL